MKKKKLSFLERAAAVPHLVWAVMFIVAPLIFVAFFAFTDSETGSFSFSNVGALSSYSHIFLVSICFALVATFFCLLIGYPLAFFISRCKPSTQKLLMMLLMLPMWINLLIRTYSLKILLETNGLINQLLGLLNIPPVQVLQTDFAIILGMVYNYLPYMVLPIYSVLVKIDKRLVEAAQDLGCSGWQVMGKVIMPLSISGVISGITMVFVPSISTFFISKSLSDGRIKLIGDVIESQISMHNVAAYNIGSALSFVLMMMILVSLFITNKFGDEDGGVMI